MRDTESSSMLHSLEKVKLGPGHSPAPGIPALVEDPVRRVYKRILATSR